MRKSSIVSGKRLVLSESGGRFLSCANKDVSFGNSRVNKNSVAKANVRIIGLPSVKAKTKL